MWSYIDKDGLIVFTIPITNIDYAVLSKGIPSDKTWIAKFYHPLVNRYSNEEIITVLYKKSDADGKNFVCFDGSEALQQLSLTFKSVEENTNVS